MNTAIATARGDWRLLGRSLIRYFAALATAILTSALLTLIIRPDLVTSLVIDTRQDFYRGGTFAASGRCSRGESHLMQSQQSSLVSGAGGRHSDCPRPLAPPAGMVGMAVVIGRYGHCPAQHLFTVTAIGRN
jgi:uncharacterized membrane protein